MHDDAVLTSTEARVEFGWSRDLMTRLLKSGALPFTTDPLDKRLKWVKRSDVARLNEASRKRRRQPQPSHRMAASHANTNGKMDTTVPVTIAAAFPVIATATLASPPAAASSKPHARAGRRRSREANRLKPSDQVVLNYLRTLCAVTGTETTPPVGYETIAERCGVCPRTAQICCDRLVSARKLERLGYDAGHPDLTRRSMVYRVTDAMYLSIEVAAHTRTHSRRRA